MWSRLELLNDTTLRRKSWPDFLGIYLRETRLINAFILPSYDSLCLIASRYILHLHVEHWFCMETVILHSSVFVSMPDFIEMICVVALFQCCTVSHPTIPDFWHLAQVWLHSFIWTGLLHYLEVKQQLLLRLKDFEHFNFHANWRSAHSWALIQ